MDYDQNTDPGWARCPFCGTSFVAIRGTIKIDGMVATIEVACTCGERWTDVYSASHRVQTRPGRDIFMAAR